MILPSIKAITGILVQKVRISFYQVLVMLKKMLHLLIFKGDYNKPKKLLTQVLKQEMIEKFYVH
jgi:hypothetical protein